MKTAKCIKCEFDKEWKGQQDATFYQFSIEFDNGDKGVCSTKDKGKPPFTVGQSGDYEIDASNTKYPAKIKRVSQGGGFGGGGGKKEWKEANPQSIHACNAVNSTIALIVADKVQLVDFKKVALGIYEWLEVYGKRKEEAKP